MSISLLYYTNNLLQSNLLTETLSNVLSCCSYLNTCQPASCLTKCELIVVSQKPLFENFIIYDGIFMTTKKKSYDSLSNYIVSENFKKPLWCKNIVVGEREYSTETLIDQIKVGVSYCSYNKVALIEHDVLYPYNYIEKVESCLDLCDICYWSNTRFLNQMGFYYIEDAHCLSRYSFKKKRIEEWMISDKTKSFEPIIKFKKDIEDDDVIVINSDPTLDIKHGLNLTGQPYTDTYSDRDYFWGKKELYNKFFIKDERINKYAYGLF